MKNKGDINNENFENVKALNDMDMAKVAGGNFFADLEDVLRRIFADDANPTQQNDPTSPKTRILLNYSCQRIKIMTS